MRKPYYIYILFFSAILILNIFPLLHAQKSAQKIPLLRVNRENDKRTIVKTSTIPHAGNGLLMIGANQHTSLTSVTGGATWTRIASSAENANIEVWFGIADGTRPGYELFRILADGLSLFLQFGQKGTEFVFGVLVNKDRMREIFGREPGPIFAFSVSHHALAVR